MAARRLPFILATAIAVLCAWSYHDAYDTYTWWLEALPVLNGFALLATTYAHFKFTNFTYTVIALACGVVLVGAHYTYPHVPLFNWLRDVLDLSRNHYDRFGHVLQGFVPALMGRELLIRTSTLKRGGWMFALIALSCLGISALYELAEWVVGEFSGASAESFLGYQGDEWDTPKDMACALTGALLCLLLIPRLHDRALERMGIVR